MATEQAPAAVWGDGMSQVPDDAAVFPMAVAEKMTGLTRRRIRYYEKAGLLKPARTQGNRRLYSPADIRRLLEIKRLLEEGFDLEGIANLLGRREERRAPVLPAGAAGPPAAAAGPPADPRRRLALYEDARARLLGKGPSGSLDRLNPGDACRLTGAGASAGRRGEAEE
jgi:DNA-binding transcriptional MerR regulator